MAYVSAIEEAKKAYQETGSKDAAAKAYSDVLKSGRESSSGGDDGYVSAIEEAKKAYEETGSIKEAKSAYGNVMQAGIDAASGRVTIPSAPGPTCPEGERLYKVSGTEGDQYVYADPEATKSDIQELAGMAGFVTSVMSPEAYPEGKYEYSRVVTTSDGRQVRVPYDPAKEAKAEYLRLTGAYPLTSRLTETGKEFLSQVREGLIAGTYQRPTIESSEYLSAWAEPYNYSERTMWREAQQIAQTALSIATDPSKCGWVGMTPKEAQIAIAFFEQTGVPGDLEKANTIKDAYATHYSAAGFPKRAMEVGYDVFGTLKDYQVGEGFNLAGALASFPEGSERDSFAGRLEPYFGAGVVENAMVQARVLSKLGSGEVSYSTIGSLLTSGGLSDSEVDATFGPGTSGEVRSYCGQYGCGVKTMGFGGFGTQEISKNVARVSWDPLGALWTWKGPINPQTGRIQDAGPFQDWIVNYNGQVKRFTTKGEAMQWAEDNGYQVQIGAQTSIDLAKETFLSGLQTPEATLIMAGFAQFGQAPITQAASQLVPTRLATWAQAPVTLGPKWLQIGLTGAKTALTRMVAPTFATTTAATFAGLSYKPPAPEVRGAESFASFKASPEYTSTYEDYMREAGAVYDKALSELGPNQAMEISREAFLQQAADEFDPQARAWFTEQAAGGMAYKPGLIGLLGRGGEVLRIPIEAVQAAPGPAWAKGLATGLYQVFAPLSVTSQLYPSKGPAALTTLIPYYGPITAATALTWKDLPWYGKALGVGFSIAPFALPIARYGVGKATAPSTHWPFPKSIISYGGKGKVYVNLGKGYGWRSYTSALELLKRDVALKAMYQPPSVFGARPGFWPAEPSPMVLRLFGKSVGPGVAPTAPSLTYGLMPGLNLAQSPYLPRAGSGVVPLDIYSDVFKGLSTEGTVPIAGTKVYGESARFPIDYEPVVTASGRTIYRPIYGEGMVGTQPIMSYGLGSVLRMPKLQVTPGGFSMGIIGFPGWATSSLSKPPVSLEPYVMFRDFGGGGSGGVGTLAPPGSLVGAPYQTTLSTLTMTQEGLLRQLHALGVIPSTVGRPGISITPGVSPGMVPLTALAPSLVPGIGISPVPFLSTGISPIPFVYSSPSPYPLPGPGPIIVPSPTDVIVRPTPPRTRIVPPPWFPTFGARLGGGRGRKVKKGGLMGVGTWGFAGFPVSGPHPLYLGTTGYTWMGDREMPYGAGRKVPRIRTKRTPKGGLIRVS